jgi:transposase InsO family protein
MKLIMNAKRLSTLQQVEDFLHGSRALEPLPASPAERYRWIDETLRHFDYPRLSRPGKGLVVAYLGRVTGYSRQQLTRLIRRYREQGGLRWDVRPVKGFATRYTERDIRLLAEMDALHDTPSGPAVKKLCERAWRRFGDARYERLAGISVSHLYNLRRCRAYSRRRHHFTKTRAVTRPIGVRRKPDPRGRPGFIRIDTVHQGDQDGVKGLYHINAVDEVTQFEAVASVERISEQFLIPTLETLLAAFPFVIRGFHADNGSEYINRRVATLLDKLRVELTKSRARHCNDNALAESKNAAVVRKFLGYGPIPGRFATPVNRFNRDYLNPYVNYHRPCYFPETVIDENGKQRKRYRYEHMTTPYEKLKSLPGAAQYLKFGVTFPALDKAAYAMSDNAAAAQLQSARTRLFETIFGREKTG